MAEFTATADKFHVHVSDGLRSADYDMEVSTAEEAIAIAKQRWAMREDSAPIAKKAAAEAAL